MVLVVKNLPANIGNGILIPESGRSPAEGNDSALQYSHLGNPMDRGAWLGYSPWDHKRSDTSQRLNNNNVCFQVASPEGGRGCHFLSGSGSCHLSGITSQRVRQSTWVQEIPKGTPLPPAQHYSSIRGAGGTKEGLWLA